MGDWEEDPRFVLDSAAATVRQAGVTWGELSLTKHSDENSLEFFGGTERYSVSLPATLRLTEMEGTEQFVPVKPRDEDVDGHAMRVYEVLLCEPTYTEQQRDGLAIELGD